MMTDTSVNAAKTDKGLSGVLCPVITPFDENLDPDGARLARQCRWLLSRNTGLAVFGTNSEANSLSVGEKIQLLDQLVDESVDTGRMMPGTGCCALPDTVRLTTQAVRLGCAGALMLPPFYYKGVSDDGLFASYSEVIERVGDPALRIYLYHIPPVSQVGISPDLIERLLKAYPDTIAGVKDSSGDWSNTLAMLERRWDGFRVFAGSESFLLQNMRHGGAGCISATANVNPAAIDRLYREWRSDGAETLQDELNAVRNTFMDFPMIPALKATVARHSGDAAWRRVRPPLLSLSEENSVALAGALDRLGFDMPGL